MDGVAHAGTSKVQLPRPRFGQRDQFLDGIRGHARVHHHYEVARRKHSHRRKIFGQAVGQIGIDIRMDSGARADHADGVAVRRRAGNDFCADDAVSTRAIVDGYRHAEAFSQPHADQPRQCVIGAACCKAHDKTDRFCRVRRCRRLCSGIEKCHARQSGDQQWNFLHEELHKRFPIN